MSEVALSPSVESAPRKSPWPVVVMILLFGLPYPLAWYLVFSDDPLIKLGSHSNGKLISPVVPVEFSPLEQAFKVNSEFYKQIEGKWLLVMVNRGPCDEVCQEWLFIMQQVRRAQGVGRKEIVRLLVLASDVGRHDQNPNVDTLQNRFPGTLIASVSTGQADSFEAQFNQTGGETSRLHVVDPYKNWMMDYDETVPPKGIIQDLSRIVKTKPRGAGNGA